MTYQQDPDIPREPRRVEPARTTVSEPVRTASGVLPTVLGVVFLLLVGLLAYNMYTGAETTPASLTPSAQAPAAPQGVTPVPKPTPPAVTPPATTPPATPQ